jgi:FdrA protein
MADGSVLTRVRHNTYVDSVTLLQVGAQLLDLPGVLDAGLVMATELNREVLREAGLLADDADSAGPNDLLIAVRASDARQATSALEKAEALLAGRRAAGADGDAVAARSLPRSVRSAHRAAPDANLALVSVPGPFAAGEARQALAEGLHVFLFSDNVSVEEEIDLKRQAQAGNLLVMGPDCGTSILNGVGLGFANVVRRGRIGLIGASGTGLQEVTSLLHQAGEGISQAIGTGGRDLHQAVGGRTTFQALELLRDDPPTAVIVLVSKPPAPAVAERVLRAAAETKKPVVACLPGARALAPDGVRLAANLYDAARLAAASESTWPEFLPAALPRMRLRPAQRQVRGLFCGGTLCDEAETAVRAAGSTDRQFVDFGDDRYTRGRAHPMIDPTLRNHAIAEAGADPRVAVVLLDVILGLGSHADPAGATVPAIRQAIDRAHSDGRELSVVAHVVGTDLDPQGLARQIAALRSAGVHVLASNYHAATAAALLAEGVAD